MTLSTLLLFAPCLDTAKSKWFDSTSFAMSYGDTAYVFPLCSAMKKSLIANDETCPSPLPISS